MTRFNAHRPYAEIRAARIIAINIEDGIPWLTLDGDTVPPGSPVRLETTAEWVEENGATVGGWVVDTAETELGYLPGNAFAALLNSRPPSPEEVAAAQTLELIGGALKQLALLIRPL